MNRIALASDRYRSATITRSKTQTLHELTTRDASPMRTATPTRRYATFAPIHYEPGYAYPLLVWLHGSASNEQELRQVMPLVSMRNYVAVAPARHVAERRATAAVTAGGKRATRSKRPNRASPIASRSPKQRFNIHPDRIFLVGHGSGGTMALRVAWNDPSRFAGVVAINGPLPSRLSPLRRVNELRHVPCLLTTSRDSRAYPADQRLPATCGCCTPPAAPSPCASIPAATASPATCCRTSTAG